MATFVITGTSRGIGLELTRQLLAVGQHVWALARAPAQSPGLRQLQAQYGSQLCCATVDVTSDAQVAAYSEAIGSTPIDVLINNAGIPSGNAPLATLSLDAMAQVMATNAIGPVRVTRALLPALQKSGAPKVIQISSRMASITQRKRGGYYGYRMAKIALNMFTQLLALEYPNLLTLAIHPGWVQTDMGGYDADITVTESARGILAVIAQATLQDSGKFFDFQGHEFPW